MNLPRLLIYCLIVWLISSAVRGEDSPRNAEVYTRLPDFIRALLANTSQISNHTDVQGNHTVLLDLANDGPVTSKDQLPTSPPLSFAVTPSLQSQTRATTMAHSTTLFTPTGPPVLDTKAELKKKVTKTSGPTTSAPPCTTARPLINLGGVQIRNWTAVGKVSALAGGKAGG
jgi:hypothetical protein